MSDARATKGPWFVTRGRFYTLLVIVGLGLAVNRAVPDNGWASLLTCFLTGLAISIVMDKRWAKGKSA